MGTNNSAATTITEFCCGVPASVHNRRISLEELVKHNTEASCWIVGGRYVYDVTRFMDRHPGGTSSLMKRAGGVKDCTTDFNFHNRQAQAMWKQYMIGVLDDRAMNHMKVYGGVTAESLVSLAPKKSGGTSPTGSKHGTPLRATETATTAGTANAKKLSSSTTEPTADDDKCGCGRSLSAVQKDPTLCPCTSDAMTPVVPSNQLQGGSSAPRCSSECMEKSGCGGNPNSPNCPRRRNGGGLEDDLVESPDLPQTRKA
jgi:hypothetical protein